MPKSSIFVRILLVLFSIGLALLVFEIFLRFFAPQNLVFIKVDPFTKYSGDPFTKTTAYHKEYSYNINLNSDGLRDNEYKYEYNPKEMRRIALFGDSIVFGQGVEEKETFGTIAEEQFNMRRILKKEVEIINFGFPGYGIGMSLNSFKHKGIKYHANEVIFVLYLGNDIEVLTEGYTLNDKNELVFTPYPKDSMLLFKIFLGKHSHLERLIIPFMKSLKKENEAIIVPEFLYLYNDTTKYDKAMLHTQMMLKKFKEEVEATNATFKVIILPAKENIDNESFEFYKNKLKISNGWDEKKLLIDIKKVLKEENIFYGDFTEYVLETNKSIAELFFLTDPHYTKEGHKEVGNFFFSFLVDQEKKT